MLSSSIIWITGASSGIGEAVARQCAAAGATVILSARRASELERVRAACGPRAHAVALDLTDRASIARAIAEVQALTGRVDVLVNNGGISQRSYAHETTEEADRKIMEVNYFGTIALTKAALPLLRASKGHILTVTSLSGLFGWYQRSAYCAAKHALHGFFEALALEEAPHGITVGLAAPGPVATSIDVNALDAHGNPSGKADAFNQGGMTAEACAARIVTAIRRKERRVVIAKKERIMDILHRYAPALFWKVAFKQG